MKSLTKIVGINLLILLVYSIVIRYTSGSDSERSLGILIMSAFAIVVHIIILLSIMAGYYGKGNKDMGKAYLLSSGIILLIGFSTCLGNASI